MIAPNNIHPPKNWQDFETLCLKLWGELWLIPDEIEFNSDNAQGQHGVDIYGPIDGGLRYNGIQCKNKKFHLIDGSPNRITTTDIQAEIDKAKNFKPALNKLIIATSLPKDQKVEEYVRMQSVANAQSGIFTIQICFWDFFERKLPEVQKVYDWYVKNENFHRVASAVVLFSGGESTQTYWPKFQKNIEDYVCEPKKHIYVPTIADVQSGSISIEEYLNHSMSNQLLFMQQHYQREKFEWHQNYWFRLRIRNNGQRVIEDFKLLLSFEGDFNKVGPDSRSGLEAQYFSTDVRRYNDTNRSLWVKPTGKILVQGDSYSTGDIFLQPKVAVKSQVIIYWQLLARDFQTSGELYINILPVYHTVINKHSVETGDEEKQDISYSLISRPGVRNILHGTVSFSDEDSDYNFS